ncbi:DUF4232 domain-containing protein [Nonomuraea sp. PA05]|uniref:DUF4232 domain-containing protein n=1 Tax=Nonomuraea sp. PA05 TaxID=2604466 RepID=UPI0011DBAB71|nr:DUF4232 domain-containing protein [Nonomuraea sp. PA05]TYB71007.1 DUF4232 domain-containing protein [Nonomuraea sp. PA05]
MTVMSAVRALSLAVLCLAGCGVDARATVQDRPPAPPTAVQRPTPRPTPAACPRSGTSLTAEQPNAAMGLRVQTIILTNCGDEVRSVHGYPRVRLLDEAGERLDLEIDKGAQRITTAVEDPGPVTVSLRPGRSARFALVWRNTYGDTEEAPLLGTTLVVGGHRVRGHFDLGSTGRLGVTAWEPAAAGE